MSKKPYVGWTCGKCGGPVAGKFSTCGKCRHRGNDELQMTTDKTPNDETIEKPALRNAGDVAQVAMLLEEDRSAAIAALSLTEHRETYGPTQNNRRTGPEDRRKSANGNHHLSPNGSGGRGEQRYGRRSGDRARWTGEKVEDAPRDVPLVEWLDRRYQEPSGISKRRMDLRDLSAKGTENTAGEWKSVHTDPPAIDAVVILGWWNAWPRWEWENYIGVYESSRGSRHGRATHWMPEPSAALPHPDSQWDTIRTPASTPAEGQVSSMRKDGE